jgi:hypothetical protein
MKTVLNVKIESYIKDKINDITDKKGGSIQNTTERLLVAGIDQYNKGNVGI